MYLAGIGTSPPPPDAQKQWGPVPGLIDAMHGGVDSAWAYCAPKKCELVPKPFTNQMMTDPNCDPDAWQACVDAVVADQARTRWLVYGGAAAGAVFVGYLLLRH